MERLVQSLRDAPVVDRDGYSYFVHPVTDCIPLVEADLLREVAEGVERVADLDAADKILTAEAMGVHHATAVTLETGIPFVAARKRSYGFEDEIAVHQVTGYDEEELYLNGISPGDRVVLLDDVYATGGTIHALHDAAVEAGAEVVDAVVVIEKRIEGAEEPPIEVKSLVTVEVADGSVNVLETA